jgi:hypothetical protein
VSRGLIRVDLYSDAQTGNLRANIGQLLVEPCHLKTWPRSRS